MFLERRIGPEVFEGLFDGAQSRTVGRLQEAAGSASHRLHVLFCSGASMPESSAD